MAKTCVMDGITDGESNLSSGANPAHCSISRDSPPPADVPLPLPNPSICGEMSHSTLEKCRPPFPAASQLADWPERWNDKRSRGVGGTSVIFGSGVAGRKKNMHSAKIGEGDNSISLSREGMDVSSKWLQRGRAEAEEEEEEGWQIQRSTELKKK